MLLHGLLGFVRARQNTLPSSLLLLHENNESGSNLTDVG